MHPSVWKPELGGHPNAVVAKWVWCRICEQIEQLKASNPPSEDKGWHIALVPGRHHPSRSKS